MQVFSVQCFMDIIVWLRILIKSWMIQVRGVHRQAAGPGAAKRR